MRVFFESSDILNSDADGSYNISFFASSIGHTRSYSESVFGKFANGCRFSEMAGKWSEAAQEERKAFLLEHHEAAHHGLLFSTPAGVLLWRLNQVLSRDVHYISKNLAELGLSVPRNQSPRKWLNSPEFGAALKNHPFVVQEHKSYPMGVVEAIEKLSLFKQVLFEANAVTHHGDMTIGELLELFRFVYPYLSARCATGRRITWTTRLNLQDKVFPDEIAFNVMDIAESHAIAKELYILRAVGDRAGFRNRLDEATRGQFGACLKRAIEVSKHANEIGFNPHAMQMWAIAACSTRIDLTQDANDAELYIEEQLPWWGYSRETNHVESLKQCGASLHALSSQPLIGAGSKWLTFFPIDDTSSSPEQVFQFLQTLSAFGLDLQIHLMHKAAHQNLMFLFETLKHLVEHHNAPFPQSAFEEWNRFLFLNSAFVEYSDAIFYRIVDLDAVYKSDCPLRQLPGFSRLRFPWLQLLGHIINGAITRRSMAAYTGLSVPASEVIVQKLEKYVLELREYFPEEPQEKWKQFAQSSGGLLRELLVKGRDVPFGSEYLVETSKERFV